MQLATGGAYAFTEEVPAAGGGVQERLLAWGGRAPRGNVVTARQEVVLVEKEGPASEAWVVRGGLAGLEGEGGGRGL